VYVFVTFALSVGGYTLEVLRSAIIAVPTGQKEAAYTVGMSTFQAYRKVILPQALRLAAAPLCNQAISTLKGTALVFNVGVVDMMRKASLLGANSQRNIEVYINAAIIYGLIIFLMGHCTTIIEKRLAMPVGAGKHAGQAQGEIR
jgi:ABC-type amino acid transport system permease subunit